jgi:hypothetical protein
MVERKKRWHSRNPFNDYADSQFFDYFNHLTNSTCQRCDSKQGPFYTINLDYKHDDQIVDTMPMSSCNKIFLCKECYIDLRKWLNIPTQDIFFLDIFKK